jgi:hypothetical protein
MNTLHTRAFLALAIAAPAVLSAQSPSAGPFAYLRSASLSERTDTLDTYESPRAGGAIRRGNGSAVIRTARRLPGGNWELVDTWFDSTGKETARQATRTAATSLVTELEYTRAIGDSASMSYTKDRVTGWVVPAGKQAQLVDGAAMGDRYAGIVTLSAIAKSRPAVGALFPAASGALYGGNPIAVRIDTIRVARRDTLMQGQRTIPVVVLARGSGETWLDESTGAVILARGNAGPERYWWHIRRGVTPPAR